MARTLSLPVFSIRVETWVTNRVRLRDNWLQKNWNEIPLKTHKSDHKQSRVFIQVKAWTNTLLKSGSNPISSRLKRYLFCLRGDLLWTGPLFAHCKNAKNNAVDVLGTNCLFQDPQSLKEGDLQPFQQELSLRENEKGDDVASVSLQRNPLKQGRQIAYLNRSQKWSVSLDERRTPRRKKEQIFE